MAQRSGERSHLNTEVHGTNVGLLGSPYGPCVFSLWVLSCTPSFHVGTLENAWRIPLELRFSFKLGSSSLSSNDVKKIILNFFYLKGKCLRTTTRESQIEKAQHEAVCLGFTVDSLSYNILAYNAHKETQGGLKRYKDTIH